MHTFMRSILWFGCWAGMASGAVLRQAEQECGHSTEPLHEVFYNVQLEPHHEIRKRSINQPLRIHLHFDDSIKQLPLSHQQLIRSNVNHAVQFWESTLRVRPTRLPIRLRRMCPTSGVKFRGRSVYCFNGCRRTTVCGDIKIPNEHLEGCKYYSQYTGKFNDMKTTSPGVSNTDFILYIAAIPSKKCQEGQTIAYAAHCQQEQAFDRPVAGYFSICPNSITSSKQNQRQLLSTMKHEILHALGFTASLYAFYRDSWGNPLTPRDFQSGRPKVFMKKLGMYQWSQSVVKRVLRPNWVQKSGVTEKEIYMMVTPKVREEVRRHFNCSSLEGGELEDQGIDGTVLTHFEKRVFENEAMTGTYTQNSVISRITLAMMEDTGWYEADYSKAEDYEWGRNLGCEFVQNSCYHWISTRKAQKASIHPFCNQIKRGELWTGCAHNRHSVALCNLVEYNHPLPAKYQYFDSLPGVPKRDIGKFAGSVALADYCPYLQEFSWTNENDAQERGSNCHDYENNLAPTKNFFGEAYSPDSLCFQHAGKWFLYECRKVRSPHHAGSGCYKYSCIENVGLTIQVHNQSHRCYQENQVIDVSFMSSLYKHQGTIVCPKCQEICKDQGISCPPERPPPTNVPSYVVEGSLCKACSLWMPSLNLFLASIIVLFSID